jgi:hypothetical protein
VARTPGRLRARLAAARERHRERHRPTGFGFALADSIDYLDGATWDALVAEQSVFLQRRYLRALEQACPDNLAPRYALIFRRRQPVAAVVMQIVTVSGTRFMKTSERVERRSARTLLRRALSPALRRAGAAMRERVVVCGNLLSWGFHGVAFARDEDPAVIWPAIAEAIYRVRRAARLAGQSDFALVKDLSSAEREGVEALRRFGYRPVESDPNMVLEIPPAWRTYDDYVASLNAKYKNAARKIAKDLAQAGCVVSRLADVGLEAKRVHALYLNVVDNAAVRPVTLPVDFFPTLAAALGDDFRATIVRQENRLVGFISVLRDGDTTVPYYIGFERTPGLGNTVYLALLHSVIGDAIELGCRRVSFGRTALEPKAGLGARPERLWLWARHRNPALNLLIRNLLRAVPHGAAPERNPFKSAPAAE